MPSTIGVRIEVRSDAIGSKSRTPWANSSAFIRLRWAVCSLTSRSYSRCGALGVFFGFARNRDHPAGVELAPHETRQGPHQLVDVHPVRLGAARPAVDRDARRIDLVDVVARRSSARGAASGRRVRPRSTRKDRSHQAQAPIPRALDELADWAQRAALARPIGVGFPRAGATILVPRSRRKTTVSAELTPIGAELSGRTLGCRRGLSTAGDFGRFR